MPEDESGNNIYKRRENYAISIGEIRKDLH